MREHTKMILMNAADYVQIRRPSVGNYMYGEEAREGRMEEASKEATKKARDGGVYVNQDDSRKQGSGG